MSQSNLSSLSYEPYFRSHFMSLALILHLAPKNKHLREDEKGEKNLGMLKLGHEWQLLFKS